MDGGKEGSIGRGRHESEEQHFEYEEVDVSDLPAEVVREMEAEKLKARQNQQQQQVWTIMLLASSVQDLYH